MLIDTVANQIPVGAASGHLETPDGSRLRWAVWRPETAHKGTVVLLQGRAEFLEKYYETVADLMIRGFAVVTFDWRGQGGSTRRGRGGVRGHVASFDEYVADLDAVMAGIVLPNCPQPYYALAHSTGATVFLLAAPEMRTRFRRAVLLAPLLGLGETGWPRVAAGPLARVLSFVGLGRSPVPGARRHVLHDRPFEGNRLTSDRRRWDRAVELTRAHPDLTVGAPTIGWVKAANAAMRRLDDPDFLERIRIPSLIVAAGADRVVSYAAIENFARGLKYGHMILVPGARHELLQEADIYREQALAAFDAFVPGT